jgi:hypothetical protein
MLYTYGWAHLQGRNGKMGMLQAEVRLQQMSTFGGRLRKL